MTTDSVVVTWPKSRPLGSYLSELLKAEAEGLLVNYRVAHPPRPTPRRCYRVYDGHVRGYLLVVSVEYRREGAVARVASDALAGFWPSGWYIVCSPKWYELERCRHTSHESFRGWRWFDRLRVEHAEKHPPRFVYS